MAYSDQDSEDRNQSHIRSEQEMEYLSYSGNVCFSTALPLPSKSKKKKKKKIGKEHMKNKL